MQRFARLGLWELAREAPLGVAFPGSHRPCLRLSETWLGSSTCVRGVGFGVCGLGFGVWGLGFGVWGWGFGASGLGFRASGSCCKDYGCESSGGVKRAGVVVRLETLTMPYGVVHLREGGEVRDVGFQVRGLNGKRCPDRG